MDYSRPYLTILSTNAPKLKPNSSILILGSVDEEMTDQLLTALGTRKPATVINRVAAKGAVYDAIIKLDIQKLGDLSDFIAYIPQLAKDGLFVAAVPNSQGFQGLLVQKSRHFSTLKQVDKELQQLNLKPIYREFIGKFTYVNGLKKGVISRTLQKYGHHVPNSSLFSPQMFFIYTPGKAEGEYVSDAALLRRIVRMQHRIKHRIENHRINDYIIASRKHLLNFKWLMGEVFGTNKSRLNKVVEAAVLPPNRSKDGKIRLAIAMTWLEMGGVERVILNIIKDLDRSKFEIHILTTIPSRNPWHGMFEQYSDKIVHVPGIIDESWSERYKDSFVREYLLRSGIDVLLITNSSNAYKALPSLKKKSSDIRVYDLLHTHGTPKDNDAYLRFSMPYEKHIDKRIVIDEYLKDYYCSRYPVDEDRVLVIYNGMDRDSLKRKVDVKVGNDLIGRKSKAERVITYLGRLEEDKSPERLVAIAKKLKDADLKDTYIAVCGDGILRNGMEKQARELGVFGTYIRFQGYIDDPLSATASSDFTILTSNSEGIPMSVLESMSVKTPSVSPAVGGIPEIIEDSVEGYLVPIKELPDEEAKIQAFADAIIKAVGLSQKEYDAFADAAQKKIYRRFGHMSENYAALFEKGYVPDEEAAN